MPTTINATIPGVYILEDDGIAGNNTSQVRFPNGFVVTFAHPADAVNFVAAVPGVELVVNLVDTLGPAAFNVGDLANAAVTPDIVKIDRFTSNAAATIVANNKILEQGNEAGADIVAASLILSATNGIGTSVNSLETQVSSLEAEADIGGLNLVNFGTVSIGGLSTLVSGLDVITSGHLNFTNYGTIILSDTTGAASVDGASTVGNVNLTAIGDSDIIPNVDFVSVRAARGDVNLIAGRDIAFGIIGTNFNNDVVANGNLNVQAGRDVIVDGFADFSSDSFGLGTAGDVTVSAGRDINLIGVAGTSASIFASGVVGASVTLTTGIGGTFNFSSPQPDGVSSNSGDVVINADRVLIDAVSTIRTFGGAVTIRPVTEGREMLLGSAGDAAFAVELSDAELDRIFTTTLTLGSNVTGNLSVVGAISPAGAANLLLRTGEDLFVGAGMTVTGSLGLAAGNNFVHTAGTIDSPTIAAQVDILGDDEGAGGYGRYGSLIGSSITLDGNADADTLFGANGVNQVVHGFGGNDTITSSGEGAYFGDEGNDLIFAGDSTGLVPEALDGGIGIDTLDTSGFDGDYVIDLASGDTNFAYESFVDFENAITGDGNDNVTGTSGDNVIQTGIGNDTLDGGAGVDTMTGGLGDDTYHLDHSSDKTFEGIGEGNDTAITSVSYSLLAGAEVETLRTLGSGSLTVINLTGNSFAQALLGNAAANVLNGGGGADTLRGYAGDDTYHIDNAGEILIEAAGQGNDTVIATVSYALGAGVSVETMRTPGSATLDVIDLTGNAFAQTLLGNAAANELNGSGGADTMRGFAGNDTYRIDNAGDVLIEAAGQGSDIAITQVSYTLAAGVSVELLRTLGSSTTDPINLIGNELVNVLAGNAAANSLNGGAGDDVLWGYLGADNLTGGTGSDTLVFTTALGPTNIDLIHGYVVADDSIMLDNAVFTGLAAGALAAGAFRIGAAAVDADDRILYNSATGELLFDADGVGGAAAVIFADMSAGLAMTAGEFFVI